MFETRHMTRTFPGGRRETYGFPVCSYKFFGGTPIAGNTVKTGFGLLMTTTYQIRAA